MKKANKKHGPLPRFWPPSGVDKAMRGDPTWLQERPHTMKVYENYRRLVSTVDDSPTCPHPKWREIIYKFTARLHLYICDRDAGRVPPDRLLKEMSELRSYMPKSRMTFEAAAEKLRGMLYRAGLEGKLSCVPLTL
jgi:hypothetical protein